MYIRKLASSNLRIPGNIGDGTDLSFDKTALQSMHHFKLLAFSVLP